MLTRHTAAIFLETALPQLLVQIRKGGGFRQRHHRIAPCVADSMLDLSFLMPLARRTEMGFEEVMGAKGDESADFMARASGFASFLQGQFDGSAQVVVADPMRNPAKVLKGLEMCPQETLLFLRRKRHRKGPAREAQPHDEHLYLLSATSDDGSGFSPVHLCILARFKFEG